MRFKDRIKIPRANVEFCNFVKRRKNITIEKKLMVLFTQSPAKIFFFDLKHPQLRDLCTTVASGQSLRREVHLSDCTASIADAKFGRAVSCAEVSPIGKEDSPLIEKTIGRLHPSH